MKMTTWGRAMVACRSHKPEVGGSIPPPAKTLIRMGQLSCLFVQFVVGVCCTEKRKPSKRVADSTRSVRNGCRGNYRHRLFWRHAGGDFGEVIGDSNEAGCKPVGESCDRCKSCILHSCVAGKEGEERPPSEASRASDLAYTQDGRQPFPVAVPLPNHCQWEPTRQGLSGLESVVQLAGHGGFESLLPPRQRFESSPIHYFFFVSFFAGFFLAGLCLASLFGFVTGRPLFPPSRMASRSASLYIPADPIYLYGFRLCLWSLLFTATDDIPNSLDMSSTVKSLIPINILLLFYINQGVNAEMSKLLDILLYICIVFQRKIRKFFENSFQNLDRSSSLLYNINVQTFGHIKRQPTVIPMAERFLSGTKGDFYENFLRSSNRVLRQRIS